MHRSDGRCICQYDRNCEDNYTIKPINIRSVTAFTVDFRTNRARDIKGRIVSQIRQKSPGHSKSARTAKCAIYLRRQLANGVVHSPPVLFVNESYLVEKSKVKEAGTLSARLSVCLEASLECSATFSCALRLESAVSRTARSALAAAQVCLLDFGPARSPPPPWPTRPPASAASAAPVSPSIAASTSPSSPPWAPPRCPTTLEGAVARLAPTRTGSMGT